MNESVRIMGEEQATLDPNGDHTVTVVICSRNHPALLQRCLAAVRRLDPAPNQILVIDNSQGNDEMLAVARESESRYAIEPVRGLSRARNRGLSEAKTDIVAFLDDDAIPEPDWLGLLLRPFADEQVAATVGRVITPESQNTGTLEQSPRMLSNQDPYWFEIATFGGLGLGANMAFRNRALPIQLFFDERLGRGAPFEIGEESYAFAWLLSRGYRVGYVPSAVVHHPPLRRSSIEHEARISFAYWLLLFNEFPRQRFDALRFLVRRLLRKPLAWPRNPQGPGEIVSSGWGVLFVAAIKGLWLFVRTPKRRDGEND